MSKHLGEFSIRGFAIAWVLCIVFGTLVYSQFTFQKQPASEYPSAARVEALEKRVEALEKKTKQWEMEAEDLRQKIAQLDVKSAKQTQHTQPNQSRTSRGPKQP